MAKVTIDIPDSLVTQAQSTGHSINAIVLQALAKFMASEYPKKDITQTRTWKLCGKFSASETAEENGISENIYTERTTNYAEEIDDVLYTGS